MKGIVFNLLEVVVSKEHGEDAWEGLLEEAGSQGAYTSLGSYPDEELLRLVAAAARVSGRSQDEVLRGFGKSAMPLLAERYPQFFETQSSAYAFLLTLNDIIHPEVRKIYPGADVPVFDFDTPSPNVLLMGYRSQRRLCALAQGFVQGVAAHYRETLSFEHLQCMHDGDEKCSFQITLYRADGGDAAAR